MEELRDWLALCTIPQCSATTVLQLLEVFSTPAALLSASCASLRDAGVKEPLVIRLKKADWQQVDACLHWREQTGGDIVHWNDPRYPRYPRLLKEIASSPLILFVKGNAAILQHHQLAVVGLGNPHPGA